MMGRMRARLNQPNLLSFGREEHKYQMKDPNDIIYLAGPMEYAKDGGKEWRFRADKELRRLGYRVYNPCSDESAILEPFGIKTAQEFLALKKDPTTLGRFRRIMRAIAEYDLEQLNKSQAIVAYLDGTLSGGTAGEVTIQQLIRNKPVFAVIPPEEITKISGWILACVSHIFKDMDSMLDYVAKYGI